MKKRLLVGLVFCLSLSISALSETNEHRPPLDGGGEGYVCPQCTTLPSGAQCCIDCWCQGQMMMCPAIGCAEI